MTCFSGLISCLRVQVSQPGLTTPDGRKWWIVFKPLVGAVSNFENKCLAQQIDFWQALPGLWRGRSRNLQRLRGVRASRFGLRGLRKWLRGYGEGVGLTEQGFGFVLRV